MRRTAVGLLILGVMLVAPTAAGGGNGPTPMMTVDPTSGLPGSNFTVSGDECFPEFATDSTTQGVEEGPPVEVTVNFPTPLNGSTNANLETGTWSVGFTVPAGTPPGPYPVTAECLNTTTTPPTAGGVSALDFTYAGGTYTVLAAPVAPAPGAPGTEPATPVDVAPAFTG